MPQFGESPKCPRCGKSVYHAEMVKINEQSWHKMCHKCSACNKLLDSTTVAPHGKDIFCRGCHGKKFGIKGIGFGMGAGSLSMESK
ncbi:LIM domain-containing protein, partial [Salmonella sp. s51228]|uniref:LIM domain-containing protein n=1 Tax=Salmonella sp. s51228 TaxID=3159652 RepID=UPI00397FF8B1